MPDFTDRGVPDVCLFLRARRKSLWLGKLARSSHEATADGSSGSISPRPRNQEAQRPQSKDPPSHTGSATPCSGPSRFNNVTVISRRRHGGGCGFSFRNAAVSHTYQEKRPNLKLKFFLNSAFRDYEIIGTGAENSQRERQE